MFGHVKRESSLICKPEHFRWCDRFS
jgi:hypothetical protein